MKIALSYVLSAPREEVFAALVNPVALKQCIPGCEELIAVDADRYEARLKIGVAGLKGSYSGRAEIRDRQPPDSLTLALDGKGSPGFVRGTAAIRLATDPAGTRVDCEADVQVGGLIAAVGSRLIEAAARKLADDFFRCLPEQIGEKTSAAAPNRT